MFIETIFLIYGGAFFVLILLALVSAGYLHDNAIKQARRNEHFLLMEIQDLKNKLKS